MTPRTEQTAVERARIRQNRSKNTRLAGATMMAAAPIIAGTGFGLLALTAGALTYWFAGWQSSERDNRILESDPATRQNSLYNTEVNEVSKGFKNWSLISSAVMGFTTGLPLVFLLARIPMAVVAWKGYQDIKTLNEQRNDSVPARTTPQEASSVSRASFSLAPNAF
jgi:hypothetical protein